MITYSFWPFFWGAKVKYKDTAYRVCTHNTRTGELLISEDKPKQRKSWAEKPRKKVNVNEVKKRI